jgi:hypothetical protein
MKNKLTDLQDHLFAQIERLGEEGINEKTIATEIKRSSAMSGLAKQCIENASLMLDAAKFQHEVGSGKLVPESIGISHEK